jgi:hypothetical protein
MSSIKHHEDISLENVARTKNALDPVDPQDYVTKSYGDANYGGGGLPQLNADPATPAPESAWVRANMVTQAGSPIGLLLGLTQAASTYTYELRYRTQQNITVGVPLT